MPRPLTSPGIVVCNLLYTPWTLLAQAREPRHKPSNKFYDLHSFPFREQVALVSQNLLQGPVVRVEEPDKRCAAKLQRG